MLLYELQRLGKVPRLESVVTFDLDRGLKPERGFAFGVLHVDVRPQLFARE
jgi:hypothetical protein